MTDDPFATNGPELESAVLGAAVDTLFETACGAATSEEIASGEVLLAAMHDALAAAAPAPVVDLHGQRTRQGRRKTAGRLAIVVGSILVGSSAAAATGNLPDAAQSAVADATAHFGLHLPHPDDSHSDAPRAAGTAGPEDSADASAVPGTGAGGSLGTGTSSIGTSGTGTSGTGGDPTAPADAPGTPGEDCAAAADGASAPGPDATGAAAHGFCTAWSGQRDGSSPALSAVATRQLQAAALAAGQSVQEFCAAFVEGNPSSRPSPGTSAPPVTSPASTSPAATSPAATSPAVTSPGEPNAPGTNPPGSNPPGSNTPGTNVGGTNPSATAPTSGLSPPADPGPAADVGPPNGTVPEVPEPGPAQGKTPEQPVRPDKPGKPGSPAQPDPSVPGTDDGGTAP